MKVLVVGYGSIGKRHLSSFKRIRPQNIYAVLRRPESSLGEFKGDIEVFSDPSSVHKFSPDLVCICTPSQNHAKDIESFVPFTRHCFVEKPIATDLLDLERCVHSINSLSGEFFYGCVMRFHPAIAKLKGVVQEARYGKALAYNITCGSYLPEWRPTEDYRKGYSAASESCGVTLDLIHEFDYAQWCFGQLSSMTGVRGKLSALEINSDDYCAAILRHESGTCGSVSVNYFQTQALRRCEAVFERASIDINILSGRFSVHEKGKDVVHEDLAIDRENLFDLQSLAMFESIENKTPSHWHVHEAVNLVKRLIAISRL